MCISVLRYGVQAALGGYHDGLVEGPDRRRVDVLHPRQIVQGEPELDRHREEVGTLLDALAADHLGAEEPKAARLGQQLDLHGLDSGVVAGSRNPLSGPDHVRNSERGGGRLTEGCAPDDPLPGCGTPRYVDRAVGSLTTAGVDAGRFALGVGVATRQALQRYAAQPVRNLGAVAGREDARHRRCHPLVDDDAAGRSSLETGSDAECCVRLLVGADHSQVGLDLAIGGLYRGQLPVTDERLEFCVKDPATTELAPRLLHRGHDVRVGHLRHRPRARVHQMRLDASVSERCDHLDTEGRGLHDHRGFDRVQDFVPLDGFANVLDVVEAAEVAAWDTRIGVVEAGGQHKRVPLHLALTGDLNDLALHINTGDVGVVVHIDTGVDVGLLGSQKQLLEVLDLPAVHVGDATRAVGDVVKAGIDDHLGFWIGRLDATCSAHPACATTDYYDLARHYASVCT